MAKTVSEIVKEAQRDYDGRIILVKADGLLQEISDKIVEDEKIEFVTTQTSIGNEDRKSTRLNSSHMPKSRMPSSA